MNQPALSLALALGTALSAWAGPSILDIRHSITDDNIIAPESFETQTRQLEENFYLTNFVVPGIDTGASPQTSPSTYQERLTRLPTVIELPYNSIVGNFIEMYVGRKRGLVADMVALHNYYGRFFEEELLKQGMPVELEYLPVIESAINPNAVSRAGAVGLWQFMPATAKGLGMEVNSLVDERRDPRLSSRNAAKYLKQLHDIYDDWSLAIAAYNCGPGNVNKALRRAAGGENGVKKDFWEIYPYLPAETRGYVPAFIAANYVMNYYREHGITPTVVKRQLTTDTVTVDKYVHFNQIAAVLNIPVEEIRMLNPQFLKDIIPGDYRPYKLTLPTQQCLSYVMSEKRILDYDRDLYARRTTAEPAGLGESSVPTFSSDGGAANLAMAARQTVNAEANNLIASTRSDATPERLTHIVKQGDTLREIARRYGVSATDIKRLNNLRSGHIEPGQALVIESYVRVEPESAEVEQSEELTALATAPAAAESAETAQAAQETAAKNVEKPRQNTSRTTTPQTTVHKVKKGDTLGSIAAKYHTTVAAIQGVNGMKKTDTSIRIGQTLKIPAKGTP
ncbi:MAG: LysM peptidoglycan-binding domain-containing protein, partial [Duncaniella sp.]|nr:LysM peptidoglycan-binding domain-containing protein [Duncaniella sp.]